MVHLKRFSVGILIVGIVTGLVSLVSYATSKIDPVYFEISISVLLIAVICYCLGCFYEAYKEMTKVKPY